MTTPSLAKATPEAVSQETLDDHMELLNLIEKLGVSITFHQEYCQQTENLGGYHTTGKELTLCNRGDQWSRLNTIRHEAWHFYQDIKDCNYADPERVKPVFTTDTPSLEVREWAAKYYEASDVPAEAEAQWVSETMTADQIAVLIAVQAKYCEAQ